MEKKTSNKTEIKWTKWGMFKLIMSFLIMFGLFLILFNFLSENKKNEVELINSNYGFVKGKIVDKSTYKIWTLTVEYEVKGVIYKESEAVKNNNLEIGDSIMIKYSNINPKLIIIEVQ